MNLCNSHRAFFPFWSEALIINTDEIVLSHAVGRSSKAVGSNLGEDIAPEPLLPNYGAARNADYAQDVKMMMLFNSKERTLNEFISIR